MEYYGVWNKGKGTVCGVYVWVYAWEGSRVLYVSVFPLPYHKPVTTHITQAVLQHTGL